MNVVKQRGKYFYRLQGYSSIAALSPLQLYSNSCRRIGAVLLPTPSPLIVEFIHGMPSSSELMNSKLSTTLWFIFRSGGDKSSSSYANYHFNQNE